MGRHIHGVRLRRISKLQRIELCCVERLASGRLGDGSRRRLGQHAKRTRRIKDQAARQNEPIRRKVQRIMTARDALAAVNACRAALRHPGHADRSERTPDHGLGGTNHSTMPSRLEMVIGSLQQF